MNKLSLKKYLQTNFFFLFKDVVWILLLLNWYTLQMMQRLLKFMLMLTKMIKLGSSHKYSKQTNCLTGQWKRHPRQNYRYLLSDFPWLRSEQISISKMKVYINLIRDSSFSYVSSFFSQYFWVICLWNVEVSGPSPTVNEKLMEWMSRVPRS